MYANIPPIGSEEVKIFDFKKVLLILLCFSLLLTACARASSGTQNTGEKTVVHDFEPVTEIKSGRPDIYVVLKVMTSQYWQDIIDGIADAGNEVGCNVYVGGPEGEGDWQSQKTLLDKAVYELGADAVMLSPASSSALNPTMGKIYGDGIPVILVDTIINDESFNTCYMTDNLQAGELAAGEMIRQLTAAGVSRDEEAGVAIQITSTSSQTVIDRLAGFNQYWAANAPESWKVLDEVKLNNGDKERAEQNCLDFLMQYPNIKGVFGCNNSSTVGFVNGLNQKSADAGNVVLVGFDYADETAALIADSTRYASTIVQNQYLMGYDGLKDAFEIINGGKSEYKFVDTGTVVINSDNQQEYEQDKAGDAK